MASAFCYKELFAIRSLPRPLPYVFKVFPMLLLTTISTHVPLVITSIEKRTHTQLHTWHEL